MLLLLYFAVCFESMYFDSSHWVVTAHRLLFAVFGKGPTISIVMMIKRFEGVVVTAVSSLVCFKILLVAHALQLFHT